MHQYACCILDLLQEVSILEKLKFWLSLKIAVNGKGSLISKKLYVLTLENLLFQFCNKLSAQERKFLLKFKFRCPYCNVNKWKSAPKIWISMKIPLLGRRFVAKMEDEIFKVKRNNFFENKLPLSTKCNHLWSD